MNQRTGKSFKVAYVGQVNPALETGVSRKIAAQARAWEQQGVDVRLFLMARSEGQIWSGWNPLNVSVEKHRGFDHPWAAEKLVKRVVQWGPDAVYLRLGWSDPALIRLAGTYCTAVEINTDDQQEMKRFRAPLRSLLFAFLRNRLLYRSSGLVTVTEELKERYSRFGRPVAVVSNGIDLREFAQLPPSTNATPRLVFLGTGGFPWHGVDKLIDLARLQPAWSIDLIGVADLPGLTAPGNVTLHGHLSRKEYLPILAKADVAVGTLGLHRKGMDEACALKTREYLASGLPVILGHRDPDFLGEESFLLKLPNTEDNVVAHMEEIRAFVLAWSGRRVAQSLIPQIDVRVKERSRLEFLRALHRMQAHSQ